MKPLTNDKSVANKIKEAVKDENVEELKKICEEIREDIVSAYQEILGGNDPLWKQIEKDINGISDEEDEDPYAETLISSDGARPQWGLPQKNNEMEQDE